MFILVVAFTECELVKAAWQQKKTKKTTLLHV